MLVEASFNTPASEHLGALGCDISHICSCVPNLKATVSRAVVLPIQLPGRSCTVGTPRLYAPLGPLRFSLSPEKVLKGISPPFSCLSDITSIILKKICLVLFMTLDASVLGHVAFSAGMAKETGMVIAVPMKQSISRVRLAPLAPLQSAQCWLFSLLSFLSHSLSHHSSHMFSLPPKLTDYSLSSLEPALKFLSPSFLQFHDS